MPTGRRVYWDSCIFISHLFGEQRSPNVVKGMAEMVAAIDRREQTLVTSVLTFSEVLEARLPHDVQEKLDALFELPNIVMVDIDIHVARLACELRTDYRTREIIELGYLDSLHLATAINYGVDIFYTFDGESRHKRRADLIQLGKSGSIGGHRLAICEPGSDNHLDGVSKPGT